MLTANCANKLDHGVLAVGYDADGGQKYWKVKNSWGTTWGEGGFVRMVRGQGGKGECGLLSQPTFPMSGNCDNKCCGSCKCQSYCTADAPCCGGECCGKNGTKCCGGGCAKAGEICCGAEGGQEPCVSADLCCGGTCCDSSQGVCLADSEGKGVCCPHAQVCGKGKDATCFAAPTDFQTEVCCADSQGQNVKICKGQGPAAFAPKCCRDAQGNNPRCIQWIDHCNAPGPFPPGPSPPGPHPPPGPSPPPGPFPPGPQTHCIMVHDEQTCGKTKEMGQPCKWCDFGGFGQCLPHAFPCPHVSVV